MVAIHIEESTPTERREETQPRLSSERQEALRRTFKTLRAEVVARVRVLRASSSAEPRAVEDAVHEAAEHTAPELQDAIVEEALDTLRQIDEARTRLEEGLYGFCRRCGGAIAAERLHALPYAVLCRSCQQREEHDDFGAQVAGRLRTVLTNAGRAKAAPGSRPAQFLPGHTLLEIGKFRQGPDFRRRARFGRRHAPWY